MLVYRKACGGAGGQGGVVLQEMYSPMVTSKKLWEHLGFLSLWEGGALGLINIKNFCLRYVEGKASYFHCHIQYSKLCYGFGYLLALSDVDYFLLKMYPDNFQCF